MVEVEDGVLERTSLVVPSTPSKTPSCSNSNNNLQLPLSFEYIPPHVRGLKECAEHHIRLLLEKEARGTIDSSDEDALDDGFVLCDLNVVRRKLRVWQHLFPFIKPFYALKCNPDPMVAAVLGQSSHSSPTAPYPPAAAGFDCASVPEIQLALRSIVTDTEEKLAAISPTKTATVHGSSENNNRFTNNNNNNNSLSIVYANPQRAEQDLDTALQLGITALTFDGAEELYKVHAAHEKRLAQWKSRKEQENHPEDETLIVDPSSMPPPCPPNLILRILVPDKQSAIPLGEKFGAPPDRWESLVRTAVHELRLPVIGVSFHCGSGNHDPESYLQAISLAKQAMETIDRIIQQEQEEEEEEETHQPPACWLLDIGGGFPGIDGLGGDLDRFCGGIRSDKVGDGEKNLGDQHPNDKSCNSRNNDNNAIVGNVTGNGARSDDNEAEEATTARIAQVVTPLLEDLFPAIGQQQEKSGDSLVEEQNQHQIHIIAEPGRYFVEGAFALCSRIYRMHVEEEEYDNEENTNADNGGTVAKGRRQRRHYYIAQGVQGVFKDCILCGESFIPIPLSIMSSSTPSCSSTDTGEDASILSNKNEENDSEDDDVHRRSNSHDNVGALVQATVHGPSGEDYDVICPDILLPELVPGDWLIFDRMGAYTLSIAARNGRPPVRYVMGGGGHER